MEKPINAKYLEGIKLKKTLFKVIGDWEHEHCVICWSKFSDSPSDLHEGYCSEDNKHWICNDCYEKYCKVYGWIMIK